MLNITLNMSKEETQALLTAYREAEKSAKDWLAQIRTNIHALEASLGEVVLHQTIASSSQPGVTYDVTRDSSNKFACECPSFKYERGLDAYHRCKHIRTAFDRPYSWRSF